MYRRDRYQQLVDARLSHLARCIDKGCVRCVSIKMAFDSDEKYEKCKREEEKEQKRKSEEMAYNKKWLDRIHKILWEKHPDQVERTALVLEMAAKARSAGLSLEELAHQLETW